MANRPLLTPSEGMKCLYFSRRNPIQELQLCVLVIITCLGYHIQFSGCVYFEHHGIFNVVTCVRALQSLLSFRLTFSITFKLLAVLHFEATLY